MIGKRLRKPVTLRIAVSDETAAISDEQPRRERIQQ